MSSKTFGRSPSMTLPGRAPAKRSELSHCSECHHAFSSEEQMLKHRKMHDSVKKVTISSVTRACNGLPGSSGVVRVPKRPPPGLLPMESSKGSKLARNSDGELSRSTSPVSPDSQASQPNESTASVRQSNLRFRRIAPKPPSNVGVPGENSSTVCSTFFENSQRSSSNITPLAPRLHWNMAKDIESLPQPLIVARKSKPPPGSPTKSASVVPLANGTFTVSVATETLPVDGSRTGDRSSIISCPVRSPVNPVSVVTSVSTQRGSPPMNYPLNLPGLSSSTVHQISPEPSLNSEPCRASPSNPQGGRGTVRDPTVSVYVCDLPDCNFVEKSLTAFEFHITNHWENKPYGCSACAYRTSWRWNVEEHIKRTSESASHKAASHKAARMIQNERGSLDVSRYLKDMRVTEYQRRINDRLSAVSLEDPARSLSHIVAGSSSVVGRRQVNGVVGSSNIVSSLPSSPGIGSGRSVNGQGSGIVAQAPVLQTSGQQVAPQAGNKYLPRMPPDVTIKRRSTIVSSASTPQTRKMAGLIPASSVNAIRVVRPESLFGAREEACVMLNGSAEDDDQKLAIYGSATDAADQASVDAEVEQQPDVKPNLDVKPVVYSEQYFPPPDAEDVKPIPVFRRAGEARQWVCEDCDFMSGHREEVVLHAWKNHRTTNAGFECARCDFRSNFVNDIFEHFRELHKEHALSSFYRQVQDDSTSAGKVTLIPYDDEVDDYWDRYNCSADEEEEDSEEDDEEEEEEMHLCQQCDFLAASTEEFTAHKANHDRCSGKFLCPECFYWVDSFEELEAHVVVHGLSPSEINQQAAPTAALGVGSEAEPDHDAGIATSSVSRPTPVKRSTPPKRPAKRTKAEKKAASWESKNKFLCDRCPFRTSSKVKLKEHRDLHDRKTLSKGYVRCPFCDCAIIKAVIKRHINIHERYEIEQERRRREQEEEEKGEEEDMAQEEVEDSERFGGESQGEELKEADTVDEPLPEEETATGAWEDFELEAADVRLDLAEGLEAVSVADREDITVAENTRSEELGDGLAEEIGTDLEEGTLRVEEPEGFHGEEMTDDDDDEAFASYFRENANCFDETPVNNPEEDDLIEPCDYERSDSESSFIEKNLGMSDVDEDDFDSDTPTNLAEARSREEGVKYVTVRVGNEREDRETYICRFCNFMDQHKPSMEDHEWQHSEEALAMAGDGRPRCSVCSFVCPTGTRLSKHEMVHRTKVKVKSCKMVPATRRRIEALKKPVEVSSRQSTVKKSTQDPRSKFLFADKGRVCFCRYCPFVDVSVRDLERHLTFHERPSKFKCEKCSYSGSHAIHVIRHKIVHDEKAQAERLKQRMKKCKGKQHIDFPMRDVHRRLLGDYVNQFPKAQKDLEQQRLLLIEMADLSVTRAIEEEKRKAGSPLNEPPGPPVPIPSELREAATRSRDGFIKYYVACMRTRGPGAPKDLPEIQRQFLLNNYIRPNFNDKLSSSRIKAMDVTKKKRGLMSKWNADAEKLLPKGAKKLFKCPKCPFAAEAMADLESHVAGHEPRSTVSEEDIKQCAYCSYSYCNEQSREEHEKLHFPERQEIAEPDLFADLSKLDRRSTFGGRNARRKIALLGEKASREEKEEGEEEEVQLAIGDEIMEVDLTRNEPEVDASRWELVCGSDDEEVAMSEPEEIGDSPCEVEVRVDTHESSNHLRKPGQGAKPTMKESEGMDALPEKSTYDEEDDALFRFAEVYETKGCEDDRKEDESSGVLTGELEKNTSSRALNLEEEIFGVDEDVEEAVSVGDEAEKREEETIGVDDQDPLKVEDTASDEKKRPNDQEEKIVDEKEESVGVELMISEEKSVQEPLSPLHESAEDESMELDSTDDEGVLRIVEDEDEDEPVTVEVSLLKEVMEISARKAQQGEENPFSAPSVECLQNGSSVPSVSPDGEERHEDGPGRLKSDGKSVQSTNSESREEADKENATLTSSEAGIKTRPDGPLVETAREL